MRTNDRFILRSIAGENLLIPTGEAALEIKGLISLNESSALLFRRLQIGCTEDELVTALTTEYDVSPDIARADIAEFLAQMRQPHILAED
jgi:hypothetical protein